MTALLRRGATQGWPLYTWCWQETLEPVVSDNTNELKTCAPRLFGLKAVWSINSNALP